MNWSFRCLAGRGERRRAADGAEVDAGQTPALPLAHGDVGGAELAVDGSSLELRLLDVASDPDRRVAVHAGDRVLERQRRGAQAAAAVALQPLALVEHEAHGADEREVVRGEGVERGG